MAHAADSNGALGDALVADRTEDTVTAAERELKALYEDRLETDVSGRPGSGMAQRS